MLWYWASSTIWLQRRYPGWVEVLGWPPKEKRWREIWFGVLAGPAIYLGIAFLVAAVLAALFGAISGEEAVAPDQIDADGLSAAGKVLTVVVAGGE